MRLNNGDIISSIGVGNIQLGCNKADLEVVIGMDYEIDMRVGCQVLIIEDAMFWINDSDTLYQITVYGDFEGKFMDCIGIGSSLLDVERNIEKWEGHLDTYVLPSHQGICFELKDADNWDELKTPIEYISVYQ